MGAGRTLNLWALTLLILPGTPWDQEPPLSVGFSLDVERKEETTDELQMTFPSKVTLLAVILSASLLILAVALGIIIYKQRRKRTLHNVENDTTRETQSITETKRDSKRKTYLWRCTATVVEMR
ncbi:hypothetical protein GN956_G25437 [Arapaima gigas]